MKAVAPALAIAAFLLLGASPASGQNKGYPPIGLKSDTIVFLAYDELPVEASMPNAQQRMNRKRNEAATEANKQLKAVAKEYPYAYAIMPRSSFIENKATLGARYVLDCALMEQYNNGENMYAGYQTSFVSPLYVEDLRTGTKYSILEEMSQTFVYEYKTIVGYLIKRIEKAENNGKWEE